MYSVNFLSINDRSLSIEKSVLLAIPLPSDLPSCGLDDADEKQEVHGIRSSVTTPSVVFT
jgi:hypothetical protein